MHFRIFISFSLLYYLLQSIFSPISAQRLFLIVLHNGIKKHSREKGVICDVGSKRRIAFTANRWTCPQDLPVRIAAHLHKINKLCKPHHQTPNEKSKEIIKKCKFCNGSYPRKKCPAYGKSCLNCNRKDHFKVCCPQNRKKVHEIEQIETDCEEFSNLEFFVETISIQDPLNINQIRSESSV